MNYEQATEFVSVLKEHNDLQRHRNAQLEHLCEILSEIKYELVLIRGDL